MYVIMLLKLTLIGLILAHSFETASLIHKIILDNQDFGLTTEAQPQTAGRAVAQFMSAWGVDGTVWVYALFDTL